MARFTVAAQDLSSGYLRGDPIGLLPDGWDWGTADTLPNVWRVTISNLPTVLIQPHFLPLLDPVIATDPEFDIDDPDDQHQRGKRGIRVMMDEIEIDHPEWIVTLDATGEIELRKNDLRPYVRQLRWNRGQNKVEKTDTRIM